MANNEQAVLMERTYEHLKTIARRYFSAQGAHTLQPTALVHEAFLKLAAADADAFADKSHFIAVAATAMRQILVDHARKKNAAKRGGGMRRVTLSGAPGEDPSMLLDVISLDTALTQLASRDERQARVIELRFFGGLSVPEVASVVGVSAPTVERDLRRARAWLRATMQ